MESSEVFSLLIRSDDTVYDIGGNIGQSVMRLYDLIGGDGRLCSFEPHPGLYKQLKQNVEKLGRSNIEVFQLALSDCCGKASFFFGNDVSAEQASTLIRDLATSVRLGKEIVEVEVDTITLDKFSGGAFPDFVKIDVEGAEDKVFKGMIDCLKVAAPTILFEFGVDLDEKKIPNHIKVLKNKGYKFYFAELTGFLTKAPSWDNCLNSDNDALDDKLIPFNLDELLATDSFSSIVGNVLAVKRQNIIEKINPKQVVSLSDAIHLMTKPKKSIKAKLIKYIPLFLLKAYRAIKRIIRISESTNQH